jgi:hypothetical protein
MADMCPRALKPWLTHQFIVQERKKFNGELVRKCDPSLLCGLLTLAHDWDLAPLVDITAKAVARLMEGKAPEDMRELFNLADDLTEEEKLAEIKGTNDPKVRAMNALNRRKLEVCPFVL